MRLEDATIIIIDIGKYSLIKEKICVCPSSNLLTYFVPIRIINKMCDLSTGGNKRV